MNTRKLVTASVLTLSLFAANPAFAGGVVQHSVQALGHSMIGSAKLVSAVIALPLMVIGHVGQLSGEVGNAAWDMANTPIGDPLPITDDIITAGPSPDQALRSTEDQE